MPHKKNTIVTEQTEGMAQMARHQSACLQENIKTWEERAIAQSSVERVFWPDLFHVTVRALKNMSRVMRDLVVYPDNMLVEIVESRGCYASNEAKETLLEMGAPFGLTREEAYRIIQLACFNVFEPKKVVIKDLREHPPGSLEDADVSLRSIRDIIVGWNMQEHLIPIGEVIINGELRTNAQLDADEQTVKRWNEILRNIFMTTKSQGCVDSWALIFEPSHILANEANLFKKTFGV